MKPRLGTLFALLPLSVAFAVAPKEKPSQALPNDAHHTESQNETPSRETLEERFENALTGAVLEGTWQMTGKGGLTGDAPLTKPRSERYTIEKASKIGDDYWLIQARIQYADRDVTVPVPVRVVWAEDTAVITLNDLAVPMLGTYSARVMVHEGFYSGIWYSCPNNYGGVMSGRIVKTSTGETDKAESADPTLNESDADEPIDRDTQPDQPEED